MDNVSKVRARRDVKGLGRVRSELESAVDLANSVSMKYDIDIIYGRPILAYNRCIIASVHYVTLVSEIAIIVVIVKSRERGASALSIQARDPRARVVAGRTRRERRWEWR